MAASATDLLTQATTNSRPTPTQVTTLRTGGGTTLQCNALTGWPTATAVHFVTYKIDTSGNKVAGSQIDMKGVVSGTSITNIVIKAGTDVGNAIGDIVEAAPTAAYANDLYSWGSAHANQDGSLITSAVQAALGLTNLSGWTPVGFTPSNVTYNGNRSYSLLFTGQDLTSFLSPGMRLRTTRTVAAPTQCTSLNGTTQYYSKTSPAGMTFTDDFTVSAWVKLSSYPSSAAAIVSRYNGTSGWGLYVRTDGTVQLIGNNAGASNTRSINSYQSVPLNKWVHISANLDMSANATNTDGGTTGSCITIDGINVPSTVASTGTSPTSLIQAGNLEIGSANGGGNLFPGKLAQVAIFSAKITNTTMLTYISQGLAGTETSLISAYSFNNSINDLNTTNANNLTANGSALATNADSPFGGQAGGTISSTLDYGIVQSATFSTNTTVVVQVPEGCTIPTTGGVSAVVYSSNKVPYGFPGQREKWALITTWLSLTPSTGSNAKNSWYKLVGSDVTAPIGEWDLSWQGTPVSLNVSTGSCVFKVQVDSTTPTINRKNQVAFETKFTGDANFPVNGTSAEEGISLAAATTFNFYGVTTVSAGANSTITFDAGVPSLTLRNAHL